MKSFFGSPFRLKVIGILLFILPYGCHQSLAQDISLKNDHLAISFDRSTGAIISITDLINSRELLDHSSENRSPWEIVLLSETNDRMIDIANASDFSFTRPTHTRLRFTWTNFAGTAYKDLSVSATIDLEEQSALSYWGITLDGIPEIPIHEVVYPRIEGIKQLGNEHLAVPVWMGQLMKQPRKSLAAIQGRPQVYEWSYPGSLSMQFVTLYNPDGIGLYAAANDSLSYRKSFSISRDSLNSLTYKMTHLPGLDAASDSYSPQYQGIIGLFEGDWITAAEQYRNWGKQQKWSRESRLKNGLTPDWVEETALWVWNREESEHVLEPAVDLEGRLGLPVSVLWHWWHNDSYDDSFPEYFPPREGKESFTSAAASAKEAGVNALIYMNQLQWGTSTASFERENAPYYAVKDINGEMRSHVYNIFTGKSLTNMCIVTDFWKNKYASLAHTAFRDYGVSGIYMDQACLSRMCYDKNHGHSLGGGNYWVKNSSELTNLIRTDSFPDAEIALAGEGGLESYLPYLDLFLTLQVSRERYAGAGDWETIPLFQSVYHEYGITFGSYSSLLSPPYDDKWPEEFAPEDEQSLLSAKFNKQFLMEQARSFVWGMQPAIANYKPFLATDRKEELEYLVNLAEVRYKGREYLMHGKFVRPPDLEAPEVTIPISRLSIYAGRGSDRVTTFEGTFPSIYSGAWSSGDDKQMAIALASISDDPFPIDFHIESEWYGLPAGGDIYIIDRHGKRYLTSYSGGNIDINFTLQPKDICLVEIVPGS